MKPESAAFMEKSREFLVKARGMFDNHWPDEAGRAAYLAGLHAAQAFIFETSGEITKSHKRVQSEFGRLPKAIRASPWNCGRFLAAPTISKLLPTMKPAPDRACLLKAPVPPSGRRAVWRTFCPRMGARRAHRMQHRSFDSRCRIQRF